MPMWREDSRAQEESYHIPVLRKVSSECFPGIFYESIFSHLAFSLKVSNPHQFTYRACSSTLHRLVTRIPWHWPSTQRQLGSASVSAAMPLTKSMRTSSMQLSHTQIYKLPLFPSWLLTSTDDNNAFLTMTKLTLLLLLTRLFLKVSYRPRFFSHPRYLLS